MAWSPDRGALRGRVAVVAGAARGAGRGIAATLGDGRVHGSRDAVESIGIQPRRDHRRDRRARDTAQPAIERRNFSEGRGGALGPVPF